MKIGAGRKFLGRVLGAIGVTRVGSSVNASVGAVCDRNSGEASNSTSVFLDVFLLQAQWVRQSQRFRLN